VEELFRRFLKNMKEWHQIIHSSTSGADHCKDFFIEKKISLIIGIKRNNVDKERL